MSDRARRPTDRDEWRSGIGLLFPHLTAGEVEASIPAGDGGVPAGSVDLDGLRIVVRDGGVVGVTLSLLQADGVLVVWPIACAADLSGGERSSVRRTLRQSLADAGDQPGVQMAQCLLSEPTDEQREDLSALGYHAAARLEFLGCRLESARLDDDAARPGAWEWIPFDPETNAPLFASVIEATYAGSLDCPTLQGRRRGEDALATHRLSGEFRPEWWHVAMTAEGPAGVVLLNPHPATNAVELVYMGVLPSRRGEGWGRRMLTRALREAADRGSVMVFLAVDTGNHYARDLYFDLGMSPFAEREVWLRFPEGS